MGSSIDDIIRALLKLVDNGNPVLAVIIICLLIVFAFFKLFDHGGAQEAVQITSAKTPAPPKETLSPMSPGDVQRAIAHCRIIRRFFTEGDTRKAISLLLQQKFLPPGMKSEVQLLSNQFEAETKKFNLGLGNNQQEVNRINNSLLGLLNTLEQQLEKTAGGGGKGGSSALKSAGSEKRSRIVVKSIKKE